MEAADPGLNFSGNSFPQKGEDNGMRRLNVFSSLNENLLMMRGV